MERGGLDASAHNAPGMVGRAQLRGRMLPAQSSPGAAAFMLANILLVTGAVSDERPGLGRVGTKEGGPLGQAW